MEGGRCNAIFRGKIYAMGMFPFGDHGEDDCLLLEKVVGEYCFFLYGGRLIHTELSATFLGDVFRMIFPGYLLTSSSIGGLEMSYTKMQLSLGSLVARCSTMCFPMAPRPMKPTLLKSSAVMLVLVEFIGTNRVVGIKRDYLLNLYEFPAESTFPLCRCWGSWGRQPVNSQWIMKVRLYNILASLRLVY